MNCEYVREYYGVPAEIGRRVNFRGKLGTIMEDLGAHIGVEMDDEPDLTVPLHPTWEMEYLEMKPKKASKRKLKAKSRYKLYQSMSDSFDDFISFCRWMDWKEKEKYDHI